MIVEELPFYSPYSSSSQSTSSRKSLSIPCNSSSFMNECVVVRVGIRLVREIGLSEVFLSFQSSECTIASCKTMQDGKGRKMVVIRVEGTNASTRVKNLPSPPRNLFHF